MTYHVSRSGQQFGPYTAEQLAQFVAENRFLASDLAWRAGITEWVPLSHLMALDAVSSQVGCCCGCAAAPGENTYLVACGSEYCRPGAGNSGADSAWQKADVWVAVMPVCHRCILTICERYLGAELKSSKSDLVRSLCALAAVALLILVAETGIFKGLGSLNLFIAIFFTAVFLYGVFGLPYYSYRSIKMSAQRASSRSGNPLKGDALLAAVQLEAARLLSAGQLKRAQIEGQAAVSSLPEGHLHRETVLVAAADRDALAARTPDAWRSWLQRRMPTASQK